MLRPCCSNSSILVDIGDAQERFAVNSLSSSLVVESQLIIDCGLRIIWFLSASESPCIAYAVCEP